MKAYAGIGSRRTPSHILRNMTTFATHASKHNWVLRSGGADGADLAFERGALHKEIFIPWRGFNGSASTLHNPLPLSFEIAERFHPSWAALSRSVKQLMARNVHQVLGANLDDPVHFVICWTPDGCEEGSNTSSLTGGTGQALRIASYFKIPIYNLKQRKLEDLYDLVG